LVKIQGKLFIVLKNRFLPQLGCALKILSNKSKLEQSAGNPRSTNKAAERWFALQKGSSNGRDVFWPKRLVRTAQPCQMASQTVRTPGVRGDNEIDGARKTCMLRGLVFKYETIADSLVETG
jgi:hypothetical protein